MTYKRIRLIILIAIGLLLIALIISLFSRVPRMVKAVNESTKNDLPMTQVVTSEDSSLISRKYIDKVRAHENINSKVRAPVSFLYVDDTYHLVIYKIGSTGVRSISDLLQIKEENSKRTDEVVYTIIDFNGFSRFQWRPIPSRAVTKIHVTFGGDSLTRVAANDSIVSYYLLCQSFSIKFSEQGPVEVYMVGEDRPFGRVAISPSDILFLKRNDALYLMIMTPASADRNIPKDLLYNIVKGDRE